jgi:hypothetical protein
MVANWLRRCGYDVAQERVDELSQEIDVLRRAAFAGV